ncbi:MAG: single-stranded DNA-binding protein [Nocardioides sp.]|uniref:single-stranded DNA-binding protein n=1 Tax=Nocardioides sp. TaxID=35761 RepID=UPI0039E41FAE
MVIPTAASLHGVVIDDPRLTVIGKGPARFFARIEVRHEAPPDSWGGSPKTTQHDLVMYGDRAARAYEVIRAGDAIVASGYVDEYEYDGHGMVEEFVAEQIGHDSGRTRYSVERRGVRRPQSPPATRTAQALPPDPRLGL